MASRRSVSPARYAAAATGGAAADNVANNVAFAGCRNMSAAAYRPSSKSFAAIASIDADTNGRCPLHARGGTGSSSPNSSSGISSDSTCVERSRSHVPAVSSDVARDARYGFAVPDDAGEVSQAQHVELLQDPASRFTLATAAAVVWRGYVPRLAGDQSRLDRNTRPISFSSTDAVVQNPARTHLAFESHGCHQRGLRHHPKYRRAVVGGNSDLTGRRDGKPLTHPRGPSPWCRKTPCGVRQTAALVRTLACTPSSPGGIISDRVIAARYSADSPNHRSALKNPWLSATSKYRSSRLTHQRESHRVGVGVLRHRRPRSNICTAPSPTTNSCPLERNRRAPLRSQGTRYATRCRKRRRLARFQTMTSSPRLANSRLSGEKAN